MLTLLLLLAAGATGETVARIDGIAITTSEFQARMAGAPGASAPAVLETMLNEAALATEAQRLGYGKDPRVLQETDRERRRLAGERYLDKGLEGVAKADEATLRALFHEQSDAVRIRTIVVASAEQATRVKERLAKGADFAAEAKGSLVEAGRDGAAKWRLRSEMEPALRDAAFAAPLQQISGPVTLGLGVALFQVQERTIASDKAFAEKREALDRFATQQLRAQAKQHLVAQLRKQSGAEIDEAFLRSTAKRLDATPTEEAHVVARVHGKPITYAEILPEIRRLARGMEGGHFSGPSVKIQVASAVVDQRVIEEAGVRAGLSAGPEVEAALARFRRDAEGRAYFTDLRTRVPRPGQADVEAYYRGNLVKFQRPGTRSCSHVLSRSRDLAQLALKRLREGQPFDEVARDLSTDSASARHGGQIGAISDAQLDEITRSEPDLGAALRNSRPGQVPEPVKSRAGWHVVQCGAYQPPADVPLAEVSAAIAGDLERERGEEAVRARLAELRGRAKVSIDEAALQRAASGK